ncbi:MAG: hypothetical protein F4W93_06940 [Dehalococcoidia bacterium]|nr:hypothetical protein [Dehalococcoidia bacterium]
MEERLTVGRVLRALLSAMFTTAATAAVFLPTLGPLLDHHYAERLPNHTHLYFGQADYDHVHPFEMQDHYHYYQDETPTDGIVYLASYDGTSPVMTDATVHAIQQSRPFVGPDDNSAIYGNTHDDLIPEDAILVVPKKPPRA